MILRNFHDRGQLMTSALFLLLFLLVTSIAIGGSPEWRTRAELSNFQETSRYPEAIDYCKQLEKASPWIRYTTFGRSPEGRDLPLLIVSRDKVFTPEEAKKSNKAVLLIINGIHAGEIAGKEASFMLLRDIAITKQKASLLDNVILLVVPIFSVDGHERFGPYNRVNQNGPKEMGWRTNSKNLNLNRDWLKAETPEMRAMLGIYTTWLPDFVIDNHVTDGADFQYDVTYAPEENVLFHQAVIDYTKQLFTYLESFILKNGYKLGPYIELVNDKNPAAGIVSTPSMPRFSSGYGALQNRPTIVTETHMLKSFEVRIKSNYFLMEGVLRKFNEDPQAIRNAVRQADQDSIQLGKTYDPKAAFPLKIEIDQSKSDPIVFKGIEYTNELSAISGSTKITYGTKPMEMTIPHFYYTKTLASTAPPLGYIIPPQYTELIDRLKIHDIAFSTLKTPVEASFESYRFSDVTWNELPFEGHHELKFKTTKVTEKRSLPPDSVVVWLNQRSNKVILNLLEPDSPDSLVSWGYFDAIFEQKEFADAYQMEKMALQMLKNDPKLKEEFENRVATDPKFAADPAARLDFFFKHSPYLDPRKDAYPIVRITTKEQVQLLKTE
jgi:murein tripeptide amidase MpaA